MPKIESDIILYTSNFCGHSSAVERFMKEHEISVRLINIDEEPKARQELVALNDGYASVPTLLFPDGEKLTEPSFSELRSKLDIKTPGIRDTIRNILGGRPG